MPTYIDIHDLPGVTAEDIAKAHLADQQVQGKHGVEYQKYWLNRKSGKAFCMCTAPSAEAAAAVHHEAHGMTALKIMEVTPDMADAFMGASEVDEGVVCAQSWVSRYKEHANAPHPLGLLRSRTKRPRDQRAAEKRAELAPLHSITSSARSRIDGGMVMPSASAVLRLTTNSYLVGACTGRSAGFSPLRMRST